MALLSNRRHLRHSQRWSQLPSQLSSIGLRSAIRQDSQRPASTLPVALRPLQSVVYALFFIWAGCAEWIESESIFLGGMITCLALLVLNCIFFTYRIYKLRNLVEVEAPSPTIRNEKLLIVGTLVLSIAVGFGVHYIPFWDSLPGLVSGVLRGLVSIALIAGIIWAGNRFFGLFREIDKESSGSPDKQ